MTKNTPVTGKIIPIDPGTRMRNSPNTYSTVVNSFPSGTQVEIDMTLEHEANDPAQPATWKGDLWGRVIKVNGAPPKWTDGTYVIVPVYMAIDYHGAPVCRKEYFGTLPPIDPPVDKIDIKDSIVNYELNGVLMTQRMVADGLPYPTPVG